MRVIQNVKNILNKRSGGGGRKTEKLNTHYDPKINMKLKKMSFCQYVCENSAYMLVFIKPGDNQDSITIVRFRCNEVLAPQFFQPVM